MSDDDGPRTHDPVNGEPRVVGRRPAELGGTRSDIVGAGAELGHLGVPESELGLLPDDLAGLDAVEIGCGTGYVSAWLARRGARPVGLDNSSRQLATAQLFQDEFDLHFALVHADGERLPFRDGSFDYAVSEYGAAIWCDPYRWPRPRASFDPGAACCSSGGRRCC
ncbi:MAG TPA: class I SAM-dependent methyltransferase [Actinomycetota bacterium]|nr:class I SAM-dependent methyltransferase [Actinomycetota bacterium]